jgi:protein ImuB
VPAASTDLTDGIRRVRRDDTPWPGSLPAPSPAVVPAAPRPAVLADDDGEPVTVNGRGELSADPATLAIDDAPPRAVVGWSGAWPLDECWWDPARHRRAARLQVLTDDGAAHLVLAEQRRWWVAATYG